SIDFGQVFLGYSKKDTIVVISDGGDSLRVSALSIVNNKFKVTGGTFRLPVGGTRAVPVSFTPTASGVQNGTLTIKSNDPTNASLVIPLRGEGVPAPVGAIVPDQLQVTQPMDVVGMEPFAIQNFGGSPLSWSLEFENDAISQLLADETGSGPLSAAS